MALVLISNGFESDKVYFQMSQPEFMCHFFTCLKKTLRERQMFSASIISTAGTFFLKQGQKSFIETIEDDIKLVDSFLGVVEEKQDKEEEYDNSAFDKLSFQLNTMYARKRRL